MVKMKARFTSSNATHSHFLKPPFEREERWSFTGRPSESSYKWILPVRPCDGAISSCYWIPRLCRRKANMQNLRQARCESTLEEVSTELTLAVMNVCFRYQIRHLF